MNSTPAILSLGLQRGLSAFIQKHYCKTNSRHFLRQSENDSKLLIHNIPFMLGELNPVGIDFITSQNIYIKVNADFLKWKFKLFTQ